MKGRVLHSRAREEAWEGWPGVSGRAEVPIGGGRELPVADNRMEVADTTREESLVEVVVLADQLQV